MIGFYRNIFQQGVRKRLLSSQASYSNMKSMLSSIFSSGGSVDEEKKAMTEKFYEEMQGGAVKSFPFTENSSLAWKLLQPHQRVETVAPLPVDTPVRDDHVRFVCVSDTHNKAARNVPPGDVLLHAGDFTMYGSPQEVYDFNQMLGSLPHPQKLVIAGNHDSLFDTPLTLRMCVKDSGGAEVPWALKRKCNPKAWAEFMKCKNVKEARDFLTNCTYLEDAETTVCGLRVYGSPWQPTFHDWGFNETRGDAILEKWTWIPEGIDVLLTHGPPIGHGDVTFIGKRNVGCVELLHTIQRRVKPRVHVFGHIHEGYGLTTDGCTTFINASTCTLSYKPHNPPVIFDLPVPEGHSKEELSQELQVISHDNGNPPLNIDWDNMDGLANNGSCNVM